MAREPTPEEMQAISLAVINELELHCGTDFPLAIRCACVALGSLIAGASGSPEHLAAGVRLALTQVAEAAHKGYVTVNR